MPVYLHIIAILLTLISFILFWLRSSTIVMFTGAVSLYLASKNEVCKPDMHILHPSCTKHDAVWHPK